MLKLSRRGTEFLSLGLTAMIVVAFYTLFASPFFKVEQIRLHGMTENQPGPLLELMEPQKGKRLLEINPIVLEKQILASVPEIKKVRILRQLFPARLEIFVEERTPWIFWKETGFWVDSEGIVLNRLKPSDRAMVPTLTSPLIKEKGGPQLAEKNRLALNEIHSFIDPGRSGLQGIILEKDGQVSVLWGDILFQLGEPQGLDKKMATLYSLLGVMAKYEPRAIEYINISVPEKPAIRYRTVQ